MHIQPNSLPQFISSSNSNSSNIISCNTSALQQQESSSFKTANQKPKPQHNIVLPVPVAPMSNTTHLLKHLVKISDPQTNPSATTKLTSSLKHKSNSLSQQNRAEAAGPGSSYLRQQTPKSHKRTQMQVTSTSAVAKKLMQVYGNQPLIPIPAIHSQTTPNLAQTPTNSNSRQNTQMAQHQQLQSNAQPQLATHAYARLRADQIAVSSEGNIIADKQEFQSMVQQFRQLNDDSSVGQSRPILHDGPVKSADFSRYDNNITPGAQMILTDTQTMIFQHGSKNSKHGHQNHGKPQAAHQKSGGKVHMSGDRKKSLASQRNAMQGSQRQAGAQTLSHQHNDSSPYVTAETASIIKSQIRTQNLRVQHRANNRSIHTQSSGNLHAPKTAARLPPQQVANGKNNLRRHARRSSKGVKTTLQAAGAVVCLSKDTANGSLNAANRAPLGQLAMDPSMSRQLSFIDADSFIAMASPVRGSDINQNNDFTNLMQEDTAYQGHAD